MIESDRLKKITSTPARISYAFIAATIVLSGWLHLATPLLATLFAYLALTKLRFFRRGRLLAVVLFVILMSAITYALGHFTNQTIRALPEIAEKAVPSVIEYAKHHEVELPFTDYDSLKDLIHDTVKNQVKYLGSFARFARGASTQFVFLLAGFVVAIGLFLNPQFDLRPTSSLAPDNLYTLCCEQIRRRFTTFYRSFVTVMGAQIIISAINTVLTSLFVIVMELPYAVVVIGVTFLCGLLPVVGNLISNTVIVGIGFTVSPRMAMLALVFLVVIHKLEYLLNSKIIGDRIRNPLWLTLLGLLIGERLMGIPGMILAPVVLHYVKTEASAIQSEREPSGGGASPDTKRMPAMAEPHQTRSEA